MAREYKSYANINSVEEEDKELKTTNSVQSVKGLESENTELKDTI